MRATFSCPIPSTNQPGISHGSLSRHHQASDHRPPIRRQGQPLLILLMELSHKRRNPKLFAFKDHPVPGSPDPPQDCNNRHNQRGLVDQLQQTLEKQRESMAGQTLAQIFQP
ncbi:unnamed protein product [Linum trigynum]|uniref:Uncharacterized protein n=1 Tax=Linum trigynum TaxID=586398 RepID=A0AAV2GZI3_9ROSI